MTRSYSFLSSAWALALLAAALLLLASHADAASIHRRSMSGDFWWTQIDNHPDIIGIATGPGTLVKLHRDGKIFRHVGTGWEMLGNDPATVQVVVDDTIYQRHASGALFRFTGTACSGSWCPGWQMIDANSNTRTIIAGGGLFQLHHSGALFRYLNQPCNAQGCNGWRMLSNTPLTADVVSDGSTVYQRLYGGTILSHSFANDGLCGAGGCFDWRVLDNYDQTAAVYWGGSLFQRHKNGAIYLWLGSSWQIIDNDSGAIFVEASRNPFPSAGLFKLRNDGSIYRWRSLLCTNTGCPAWSLMHPGGGTTVDITLEGMNLYRLDL